MEFLVLHTASVPEVGQVGQATVYRVNDPAVTQPDQAAIRGAAAMQLRANQKEFVVVGPAYLPFTVTPGVTAG